jgi:hypothetical protein
MPRREVATRRGRYGLEVTRRGLLLAIVVVVALVPLTHYLLVWRALSGTQVRTSDFTATYVGSQIWRSGQGADLYNHALQLAGHRALGAPDYGVDIPYVNPPIAAVAASPFTLLGIDSAYRLWGLVQVLLLVAAIAITVRVAPWPQSVPRLARAGFGVVALAGIGTGMLVVEGQWDGVPALGLALAYAAWRRGRPSWAAVALVAGFATTKPHLALALAAFLIARGERRALVAGAAAVAASLAVPLVLVGAPGTAGFVSALHLSAGVAPVRSMLGLTGLLSSDLGTGSMTAVIAATGGALAVIAAAALGRASRRDPSRLEAALAGATVLSLLCTPHLLAQDLVVLAPTLVWCLARLSTISAGRGAQPWREAGLVALWAAMGEATALDLHSYTGGDFGRLVPWTLLVASVLACFACGLVASRRTALSPAAALAAPR